MSNHMERLKADNKALREALEACVKIIGPYITTTDAGLPSVVKTIVEAADCHTTIRNVSAVLKQHGSATP